MVKPIFPIWIRINDWLIMKKTKINICGSDLVRRLEDK